MMSSTTSAASLTRSTSAPVAITDDMTLGTSPSSPTSSSTSSSSSSSTGAPQREPRIRGNKATAPVTIPSKSSKNRPDPIAIARHRPLSTAAPAPTSPASGQRRGRANSANNIGASTIAGPSPVSASSAFSFGVPNSPAASPASGVLGMSPSPSPLGGNGPFEPQSPMTVAGYQTMSPAPSTMNYFGYQPSTKTPPPSPAPPLTPRSAAVQSALPLVIAPNGIVLTNTGSLGSSPTFSMAALQTMEPPSPAPPMDEPESPYPAGAAAIAAAAAKALLSLPQSATSPPMSPSHASSSSSSSRPSSSSIDNTPFATGSGVVLQSFSPLTDTKIGSPIPPSTVASSTSSGAPTVGEKVMYIVRGISGSGKSTLSKSLLTSGGVIISTDDFFMTPAGYRYNPNMLQQAHRTSQNKAATAVGKGITPIIIDNTHTQRWEAKFYVTCAVANGYTVKVVEPDTPWKRDAAELAKRNTHSVPQTQIQRMLDRWEDDFSVAAILASEAPKRGPNGAVSSSSSSGRVSAKHSPITGVSPGVSPSITPAGTPAASPQQSYLGGLSNGGRSRLRVPASSAVFVDSPSTSPQASPRASGQLFFGGNTAAAPQPLAIASKRSARSSAPAVLESGSSRAPLSNPFAALEDDDDDDNNNSDNNSDHDDD